MVFLYVTILYIIMSIFKKAKDYFVKFLLGKEVVPKGLFELHHYFRTYGQINFKVERSSNGEFLVVSQNFKYGSIVTSADSEDDLSKNIQDAVLTAFSVPSSYSKEADTRVNKVGEKTEMYAAA